MQERKPPKHDCPWYSRGCNSAICRSPHRAFLEGNAIELIKHDFVKKLSTRRNVVRLSLRETAR